MTDVQIYKLSDVEALGSAGVEFTVKIDWALAVFQVSLYLRGLADGNDAQLQMMAWPLNHWGNKAYGIGGVWPGMMLFFPFTGAGGGIADPTMISRATGVVDLNTMWVSSPFGVSNLMAEAVTIQLRADTGADSWTANKLNDVVEAKAIASTTFNSPVHISTGF